MKKFYNNLLNISKNKKNHYCTLLDEFEITSVLASLHVFTYSNLH